jgi:hypothetical protein
MINWKRKNSCWKVNTPQVVKKFPVLYGTWMLITVFTRDRHGYIPWDRQTKSTPSHLTPSRLFNFVLPSTLRSSKWSLSLMLSDQHSVSDSASFQTGQVRGSVTLCDTLAVQWDVKPCQTPQTGGPPFIGCPWLIVPWSVYCASRDRCRLINHQPVAENADTDVQT